MKSLSLGQIKALYGIGDTKEIKSRKSFEYLRSLTEKHSLESLTTKSLLEEIDTTEIFYQTYLGSHLDINSDCACA